MYFAFFVNFMVFENEIKVCLKIYKKNYFYNLESLYDDMKNNRLCRIFHRFLIVYACIFYFMNQIRSFFMISMFIINRKNYFCILLFCKFYVFWKWNKSLFKNLQKKLFLQFGVFMWRYTIWSTLLIFSRIFDFIY